jgi:3-deoxy-manno-octulosonate cytidylyltransferase (CMP-KDO synthetase)
MGAADGRKVLAVVPARYASTRFPGKVVASLAGKPLVAHTYDRTRDAALVNEAVVATDHEIVRETLEPLGIPVVMTRPDHVSGTDRAAEVVENTDAVVVVNVQGDEPLIDPALIDAVVQPLLDDPAIAMATACRRITDAAALLNPNVVKVACALNGDALYFSRHAVPFVRETDDRGRVSHWHHIGIYAYQREALFQMAGWAPTPLELAEKLEQLRALEHGLRIRVIETDYECIGVDTPEDLDEVERYLAVEQVRGQ